MPTKEAPSYSSARVQRATRINGIEAARLQQRLHYIELAKLHQCRLTNQDIRLISMSIDYIQASSGHSPEAWRPAQPKIVEEDEEPEEEPPCFLYGERIWSRKKRRFQRPVSAVERSTRTLDSDDVRSESVTSQRPQSSPGKARPVSAGAWLSARSYADSEHGDLRLSEVDACSDRWPSRASTPRDRVTPHQEWEDGTSDVTKKILKAQYRAQSGKRQSVYVQPEDVLNSGSTKNVRGLIRKIRISATPLTSEVDTYANNNDSNDRDFSPRRPGDTGDGLGRRATLGEILNQRRPTLSAGAWKAHLKQTSALPMSMSGRRQMVMEARKEVNDSRTEMVNKKVKEFIRSTPSSRRSKSA